MDPVILTQTAPFSLTQSEKEQFLLNELNALCELHRQKCADYRKVLDILYAGYTTAKALREIPFLPVGLFKQRTLSSIEPSEVFKVLTSSGTTGQAVSKIYLDAETAQLQTKALSSIMKTITENKRLPMIILDSSAVLNDRTQLTARATAILGMMNFGRDHIFALDENMEFDQKLVSNYLEKYSGQRIFFYGFTFMVWEYFCKRLANGCYDLHNSILLHSGGWKKLIAEQVSKEEFNKRILDVTGIRSVYNFYGTVEQVGSIFLEGDDGFLYAPNFADVIIRDPIDWKECPVGTPGVIQILSALPQSYPGHSILTEDLGVVHGIDNSTCKRGGKKFSIIGRVPRTALRGCSDVHAYAMTR